MVTVPPIPTQSAGYPSRKESKTLAAVPHFSERFSWSNNTKPTLFQVMSGVIPSTPPLGGGRLGEDSINSFYKTRNIANPIGEPKSQSSEIKSTSTVNLSFSGKNPPITILIPSPSDAASRLYDPMPFTITAYPDDKIIRPSFPMSNDEIKPVLKVSCVDRSHIFWNDFKITWGPAWDDQPGCRRLRRSMNRRGIVTGWKCKVVADDELGYIMEAKGHRPRCPKSLVAEAIREAFSGVSLGCL